VARGDLETARNEYEAVLSNLDAGPVNREVVEIKLNDLPQPELVPADPES
jgi:predicted negative regulator of RcsB-dependent stress response